MDKCSCFFQARNTRANDFSLLADEGMTASGCGRRRESGSSTPPGHIMSQVGTETCVFFGDRWKSGLVGMMKNIQRSPASYVNFVDNEDSTVNSCFICELDNEDFF